MAERQIIRRNENKINERLSDYRASVNRVNTIIEALTDVGYNLSNEQAQALTNKNFNDEALEGYATALSKANAPTEKALEIHRIATNLKEVILKAVPGFAINWMSLSEIQIKNLKAVEDSKYIKSIEDGYTVYAEGEALEVFKRLQRISDEFNILIPQLRKSVLNRRLNYSHLVVENNNGQIIPNIEVIDFKDL